MFFQGVICGWILGGLCPAHTPKRVGETPSDKQANTQEVVQKIKKQNNQLAANFGVVKSRTLHKNPLTKSHLGPSKGPLNGASSSSDLSPYFSLAWLI